METPILEIGGFVLHAPVTVLTNLVLTAQCSAAFVALRSVDDERGRHWAGFFLMMAIATFAGAIKHGGHHALAGDAFLAVLAVSNVTTAVSTYFAQRATLRVHATAGRRASYHGLAALQLGLFVTANIVWGPDLMLLIASTVVGLVPVLVTEAVHSGRTPGAGSIAAGLAISMASGLVYVFRLSAGPWLNHVDIAHVVMSVSLLLMSRGAIGGGRHPWT